MATPGVALPASDWISWNWVCLRGAGFPVTLAIELAASDASRAVDAMLAAERECREARTAALRALREEERHASDAARMSELRKAGKLVTKNRPPPAIDLSESAQREVERMRRALSAVDASRVAAEAAFSTDRAATRRALVTAAQDGRFREAVAWQNRHAIGSALDVLLASPETFDSETRRAEELVAKYLHRYTTKNESIGFFGPWGWARCEHQDERIRVRPGATFIAHRETYFEQWGIDALAETFARDPAVLPWVAPRKYGFVRVEGNVADSALSGRVELEATELAAIRVCDARTPAREIAKALVNAHSELFADERSVFAALDSLREKQLVGWSLEIPLTWHPEEALRARIAAIGDEPLRERCLSQLRELEEARDQVAASAGRGDAVVADLGRLEQTFERLTGASATRNAGVTYGVRTLVLEDARRNVELSVGPKLLGDLAPALKLVLDSARCLTHETARAATTAFSELHATLAKRAGSKVPLADFWFRAQRLIFGKTGGIGPAVGRSIRERWTRILSLSPDAPRASYDSASLAPLLAEAFPAPRAGWASARYQAPDLLLAAQSVEAIERGDYFAVLGEIHVALNTMQLNAAVSQHPSPDELVAAMSRDLPEDRFSIPVSKTSQRAGSRMLPGIHTPREFQIEAGLELSALPRERVLPLAELFVVKDGDRLVVTNADGRALFDVLDLAGGPLTMTIVSALDYVVGDMPHVPRITFDKLVVRREEWQFSSADLAFAAEKTELERFVGARRWAQDHGIPRFAFLRSAIEVKPLYVDFDNPVAINVLAKFVRAAREHVSGPAMLRVAEMLPAPTDAWLPDARGNRYTSELRFVFVDQRR